MTTILIFPKCKNKKAIISAGILSVVLILALLILLRGGHYLVKYDPLQPADALLILTGSKGDRALHAADLFHKQYAPLILIVNDHEPGKEYLSGRGVYLPNAAEITCDLLVQLQVPDSLIILLPGAARSTLDEANATANWLQTQPQIETLILISSEAHTKRAYKIFKNRFRKNKCNTTLLMAPSPYTGFQAKGWYTHRESAKDVFNEYAKLIWFWLIERW